MNSVGRHRCHAEGSQFRAVLRPYRSLSALGFIVLMVFVSLVSFAAGIMFLLLGAWPVFGFFGLDVLLIYLAFRRNYQDASECEIIEIADHRLTLTQIDRWGRRRVAEFNPAWVRLDVTNTHGGDVTLNLVSHGKAHGIGRCLNSLERRALAEALGSALFLQRGAIHP